MRHVAKVSQTKQHTVPIGLIGRSSLTRYQGPKESQLLQIIVCRSDLSQVRTGGVEFRSMASKICLRVPLSSLFLSLQHHIGLAPLPSASSAGFIWPSSVSQPRRAGKGPAATAKVLKALELTQRFGTLCSRSHTWVSLFAGLQFAILVQERKIKQTRSVFCFVFCCSPDCVL